MNILIITTTFPPDSAISAVRPFMLAKYLRRAGHEVTVLRRGNFSRKPDDSVSRSGLGIRVVSAMGDAAPAERYERGELSAAEAVDPMFEFPSASRLRRLLQYPVRILRGSLVLSRSKRAMKKAIRGMRGERFDVVFSTFGELENIHAGQYAARVFGCKYIQDFRDLLISEITNPLNRPLFLRIQKRAATRADCCTVVSQDAAATLAACAPKARVETLYNGYEESSIERAASGAGDKRLTMCYTGTFSYSYRTMAPLFAVLRELADEGAIDLNRVEYRYAGHDYNKLLDEAKRHNVESILKNCGYVSRDAADELQRESDFFVFSSWNTQLDKGVMTGKFYEALRARVPAIAVVSGTVKNSELRRIIERYSLGICYETADDGVTHRALREYLLMQYARKTEGIPVLYEPDSEAFEVFRYDNITRRLLALIETI